MIDNITNTATCIILNAISNNRLINGMNGNDHQPIAFLINIDITNAWKRLGELIGEGNPEELINNLFTNFCLGK